MCATCNSAAGSHCETCCRTSDFGTRRRLHLSRCRKLGSPTQRVHIQEESSKLGSNDMLVFLENDR